VVLVYSEPWASGAQNISVDLPNLGQGQTICAEWGQCEDLDCLC